MTLIGVEVYGAPILATWAGKELAIAGRVVVLNNEQKLEEHTVFIDDAPLYIPYLAIHLDREVNEKGPIFNKQEHLLAIATIEQDTMKQNYLEMLLRRHFSFHTLVSFDLFLVPLESARCLGNSGEMIASYRLDNLASTHAALVALAKANKPSNETLQLALFWDHEEIGSESEVGADSDFLPEILERIAHCLNMDREEQILLKNHSLCVSVDNAQGFNPIYAQKYDPNHKVFLGKGVAIKHNAGLRYVTNAVTSSKIIHLCQKNNIAYQLYVNRSDISSGSTVGPLIAKKISIDTVDIGCPQLSMHASRELMACQDYLDLCTLLTHFFEEEQ
jgi:aspartyl aminopeptidase